MLSFAVTTSTSANLKAATELVVPKSIPIALPIADLHPVDNVDFSNTLGRLPRYYPHIQGRSQLFIKINTYTANDLL
ncbi:hypothetical protein DSM107003_44360 [Trichormus variabilis SAG 1403-4b]|uniref:Uncharacterized protein n=1 Tax=Trichormus variabilis SAG 1403-4b TaxID=447716 RepID=A0A433UHS9_ANAVA|nr:hypothetical protein DSM107003_44360 [Trichormus variabilis SAG 1403-4b]